MEKLIKSSADIIKECMGEIPKLAIVLGSGLGNLIDRMADCVSLDYSDIPGFPVSTVKGHQGKFVVGNLGSVRILAMQGRVHFYEGYSIESVVLPIYIMAELGIENLILTNAAGGIANVSVGDLMIIEDHLGFSMPNPLIGKKNSYTERFPDMSEVYKKDIIGKIKEAAKENKIDIKKGVYAYSTGPSYETPAEIKALRTLGASAVGMSTVPEALVANACSINVAAISCITNMAAGLQKEALNHEDVIKIANIANKKFTELIISAIVKL